MAHSSSSSGPDRLASLAGCMFTFTFVGALRVLLNLLEAGHQCNLEGMPQPSERSGLRRLIGKRRGGVDLARPFLRRLLKVGIRHNRIDEPEAFGRVRLDPLTR